jgi:iron complex transport system substrate-binding protein
VTKRVFLLAGAALAALVITACSDDEPEATPTTTPTAAATATVEPTATETMAPEPTEEPVAEAAFPLTVRDLMGREVTIQAAPERIVTTSPSALELLYAAGGTAIARSTTATGVPGAEDLVDVGPSYEPAFEVILQQQPDLVVADVSAQAHLAGAFEGALQGVPIVFVGAVQYADIPASIRLLGQVTGNEETAEAAAADAEAVAADIEAGVSGAEPVPTLVLVAGRDGGMSAALNDSFIGDLIRIAGAENVAADLPQSGQVPGYALVSLESVVADDPEVILVIVPGGTGAPSMAGMIAEQFPDLQAVQSQQVHEIDLETYLQAPGPRAIAGLQELVALLHPEA